VCFGFDFFGAEVGLFAMSLLSAILVHTNIGNRIKHINKTIIPQYCLHYVLFS
jgi:hypothetical protein